jgi:hypothetical protein
LRKKEFSVSVYNMPEISGQHVERLASAVAILNVMLSEIQAGEVAVDPTISAMVAEKVARRECLVTGEIVPEGERYIRGLSPRGENKVRSIMAKGHYTERDFIRAGKMTAQAKKGGRKSAKPDSTSDLLAELEKARNTVNGLIEGEEDRHTAHQKTVQTKGKKKPKVNH